MIMYKLSIHRPHVLEFRLLELSGDLLDFLSKKKIYITNEGVLISYNGSHLTLEDSEGPSGIPVGIMIPSQGGSYIFRKRLAGNRNTVTYKKFKSEKDLNQYSVALVRAFDALASEVASLYGWASHPILFVIQSV